jgi:hypothetical protein
MTRMRRLLPLLLAALFAAVAQPALANQMVVRGTVAHHHHHQHFVFRKHAPHDRFVFGSPFLFPNNAFFVTSPFAQTTPFVTTSPFVMNGPLFASSPFFFDGGAFGTLGWGSGGFGAPVALGGDGEAGVAAEPRIIVVAAPFGGPPPRPAEPAHATVEQTAFGVTIIRGSGSGR